MQQPNKSPDAGSTAAGLDSPHAMQRLTECLMFQGHWDGWLGEVSTVALETVQGEHEKGTPG